MRARSLREVIGSLYTPELAGRFPLLRQPSEIKRAAVVVLTANRGLAGAFNANLIKDEIFRLAKQGSAVIFSTHRMEQVEEISNHIILVNKGQKILDGSIPAVKQEFKENLFCISVDPVPEDMSTAPFDLLASKGYTLTLRIRNGHTANEVLSWFIARQSNISGFTELLPSLNEIFIRLVEGTPASRQFQTLQS